MPNNDSGSNGAITALLAILVIAVVAFGIWYVMKNNSAPVEEGASGGIDIEIGGSSGGGEEAPTPGQ